MGSPENSKSVGSKREVDDSVELKSERGRDEDEDWEGSDRRKHRSSKARKSSGGGGADDIEGENSGRRKSIGERSDSRKRSSGSKYSDEDDSDARRERDRERPKLSRKSKEESSLEKLSTWYQEGDLDKDGGERSSSRGYNRGDESDRRKSSASITENDKSLSKEDVTYEKDDPRRHHSTTGTPEADRERSYNSKSREGDREFYADERSRGSDDGYKDRRRDHRDSPGDSWKRSSDPKGGDAAYSHGRERDFQRLGRDRNESDRHHSRSGGNVIEIQIKPVDYEKGELGFAPPRRADTEYPSSSKLAPNVDDWAYGREDRGRRSNMTRNPQESDYSKERYSEDVAQDQASWQEGDDNFGGKGRGRKGPIPGRNAGGQTSSGGSQSPYVNQDPNRMGFQGGKGNRPGGGRSGGRENHQGGFPPLGSSFGPLGMPPPGSIQSLNPGMSPAPGPPMPPFIPPVIWPGGRGMDMNMLGGVSPLPGQSGPRFPLNMGAPPNPNMFFNQLGTGRGMLPGLPGPGFIPMMPGGLAAPHDAVPGNWGLPRISGPPGKAPSRGEQNDYSQNFVDTGMRPQNFIRELELTNVVEDYPKLRELIQKKDEIVSNSSAPPMYYKCNLREHVLSPEFFGTKFDVILVDPPWEEYVHRAPGVADNMEYWTLEEIMNLKIEVRSYIHKNFGNLKHLIHITLF